MPETYRVRYLQKLTIQNNIKFCFGRVIQSTISKATCTFQSSSLFGKMLKRSFGIRSVHERCCEVPWDNFELYLELLPATPLTSRYNTVFCSHISADNPSMCLRARYTYVFDSCEKDFVHFKLQLANHRRFHNMRTELLGNKTDYI